MIGENVELKIFLKEEAAAVFCYAEVIESNPQENDHIIKLIFTSIRDEDQDLLVRASLHLQSQQLKKRAKKKQQID